MITITAAEIENYRSIIGSPLSITPDQLTVIVGPNNSGKSNILRALELFFRGETEGSPYHPDVDFPKDPSLPRSAQTKITVTVKYDPAKEVSLRRALDDIESSTAQTRLTGDLITLRLSYSKNGVESWQFLGQKGTKNIAKDLIHRLRDSIRQSVIFKYIPVGRDSLESITSEISTELIRTIFSGWSGAVKKRQEINGSIAELLEKLTPELKTSSSQVTSAIRLVFPEIGQLDLKLPFSNLEEMLPSLTPAVMDTAETGLKSKGAGIQTSSLLFLLKYLADNHPQRHNARQTFVWAIEEPESFLHPSKQRAMAEMIFSFSSEVQTLITSHCPHFVPRTNTNVSTYVIEKNSSAPFSTQIIGSEYETARSSLGVGLLDAMIYFPVNVVLEGPSDEILFRGAMQAIRDDLQLNPYDVKFFPAGNATSAAFLFESLDSFAAPETQVRVILDGDEAGKKALAGLLGRAARDGRSLKANRQYFQLPSDAENLLSDRIKRTLHQERPTQTRLIEDTSGKITSFSFSDAHKRSCAERAVQLGEPEDFSAFKEVLDRVADSLNS
jgi:predicted ATP-dependent endonuclease of OLD family